MEEVILIKTKDGKLFKTAYDAQTHVVDRVCRVLDTHLSEVQATCPWFNKSHIIDIIDQLTGDYEKTSRLLNELNNVFE